jgi:multiple sugar transport system ATP-binding protein
MACIRLDNLTKQYLANSWALRGLNLEIADGELVVMVGPSGCGKSTTLKLIAGLETPTSGRVFLNSDEVTRWPPHRRDVSLVFQNHALYPHLTVRDNLAFGLRLRRTPRRLIHQRIAEVADWLGLHDLLDRKPAQLSGGQRQRVALGRALARRPRVFLLDEPFAHLDAQLRTQTRTELRRLHQHLGATMLHVTHDQEEALTLGDRVAVLRDGSLQQLAPPKTIYRTPANQFVATFIGAPPMNLIACRCRRTPPGWDLVAASFTLPGFTRPGMRDLPDGLILGIRPRDIRLAAGSDADAVGRVEMRQPMGSEVLVLLQLAGQTVAEPFRLIVPATHSVSGGNEVGMVFPREQIHLFDSRDGRSLLCGER